MKYVIITVFNAIAFFILAVFIFGNGGMMENMGKIQEIGRLEKQKVVSETELEDLRSRLVYLKTLRNPNTMSLLAQGKKTDKLVVFKFVDTSANTGVNNPAEPALNSVTVFKRIYFSVAIIAAMIIAGNIALLARLRRPAN